MKNVGSRKAFTKNKNFCNYESKTETKKNRDQKALIQYFYRLELSLNSLADRVFIRIFPCTLCTEGNLFFEEYLLKFRSGNIPREIPREILRALARKISRGIFRGISRRNEKTYSEKNRFPDVHSVQGNIMINTLSAREFTI